MDMVKGFYKKLAGKSGESGMTMLEGLVAIVILGGAALTMIFAMSGGALAVKVNGEEVVLQNLARSQMEYIKTLAYNPSATTYPAVSAPEGYSISVGVTAVPGAGTDIQKVTANISHGGIVHMTVTDYKVNR